MRISASLGRAVGWAEIQGLVFGFLFAPLAGYAVVGRLLEELLSGDFREAFVSFVVLVGFAVVVAQLAALFFLLRWVFAGPRSVEIREDVLRVEFAGDRIVEAPWARIRTAHLGVLVWKFKRTAARTVIRRDGFRGEGLGRLLPRRRRGPRRPRAGPRPPEHLHAAGETRRPVTLGGRRTSLGRSDPAHCGIDRKPIYPYLLLWLPV